ncbi:Ger(x)C family spore germination protein [Lysinibacillus telephonicus]|uniref:Ger(X)C family spore germination protein n=1 Tax=Lysinibacillus telephonicus TaxID=1714840 RepID=A0A3S0HNW0_9BACI|nr:Ger(x)C family spore germination protein [Lysinibacillus telephonicus]RTQ94464.1 Ger(x)C family spore germination protein [Lysinibacillus telephonicus]
MLNLKKQKPLSKIIYFLFLLLILSGCWDQTKIDERAYVIAIGLDKGDNENQIKITYLITNPELSKQEGGSSNEPPREIITFQTNDLISAKDMANTVVAKEITYSQLGVFLVSEELAKDKDLIRCMYDATKDREIKRSTRFIVTKENASDFLKENQPKLETRIHKYFELILDDGIEKGYIPDSRLYGYFRITEADADLYLAIYGTTERNNSGKNHGDEDQFLAGELITEGQTNNTQFSGSAVFKEGKMVGKLNSEETRLSTILNESLNAEDMLTTFPDPFNEKYRITTRIMKKSKNKVKMNLKNGTPTIDVTIPLYIEVLSNHSMVNYAKNKEKRDYLKKYLDDRITSKFNNLVKRTQEEFKGQPFGWSLIGRKEFLTIPEYDNFDWVKTYPSMKVNISVEIKFGEFGRQSELPDLQEVRD